MKTVCVYHSRDLDGWMSAAVVKHWWEKEDFETSFTGDDDIDTIDFIGWDYGGKVPNLSVYDKVIMCDISFPADEMFRMFYYFDEDNFIWIDHHISAINDSEGKDYESTAGIRDVDFAACELTWMYFFDRKESDKMPEIVRLLGLYDSFRYKETNEELEVLEFQYAARAYIKDYNDAYDFLVGNRVFHDSNDEPNTIEMMKLYGSSIYSYLCTEAKQTYKKAFEIEFSGEAGVTKNGSLAEPPIIKFFCVNQERFNPVNFGIDYHKDGYDGFACFWYKDGKWVFSLYNDSGKVDCSEIAKQHGGGGHKGAAGFVCDTETLLNIIK